MIGGAKSWLTKARARIGAALLLVCVLALSAEGDVSGGRSIADDGVVQKRAGAEGFTYSKWLKDRRIYSGGGYAPIDNGGGGAAAGEKPGSFWGDVAGRLGDNAISRTRGKLLGVFPRGSELRDILVKYGNGEEFDMAQWREIRKRHLQEHFRAAPVDFYADAEGALASALSDTAVDRLGFVRRARIDWRTSLGGRSGNLAADAAGAFLERADDVIGWQLRAFGAQGGGKGGNAGLYYRRVWGDALAGVNVFADYEDDDIDGDFWRWSFGGEVKSRYGELSANHYFVLTDPRPLENGGRVYSRGGYDAALAFRVPRAEWLRAELAYYNFKGEFGDADDSGLRLGLDVEPGGGLIVGVEYDQESGDFGGNIAFERDFGEPWRSAANAGTFDPRAHFFDLVRREYTQRITRTDSGGHTLAFYLATSQLSVFVDAPGVSAVVGGGGAASSPAFDGFTATVSPGPPFAVSGLGVATISLAGLERYALTANRDVTLETEESAAEESAAIFRHLSNAWAMTLRGSTRVKLDGGGILSVSFGDGVFERFRPDAMSAIISDSATLHLGGTRVAFTTILSGSDRNIIFNLQAGAATIGATTGGSVNVQNGATAVLPLPDGGHTVISSCRNAPVQMANIRFACEAANAPPVAIVGGGTEGGVVVPAELNIATLVATLISLGGAHPSYDINIISGGDLLAISRPDNNGVVEASVLANPRSGEAELVVDIRDRGGDAGNALLRTLRVRVLERLALQTSPSGAATITTQQSAGATVFLLTAEGGTANYVFNLLGDSADDGGTESPGFLMSGFELRQAAVINSASIENPRLQTLHLEVRDGLLTRATITATVQVVDPPQLELDLSDISPVVASANFLTPAGNAIVRGGLDPRLSVEYDEGAGDVSITINARTGLLQVRGRELIALTITIMATDSHTRVTDVMGVRTISISPGLVLPLPDGLADGITVTTFGGIDVVRADLATFRGETRFTVLGYALLNNYGGILALATPSGESSRLEYIGNSGAAQPRTIAVSIEVRDNSPQDAPGSTPDRATAMFSLAIVNPPAIRLRNEAGNMQNTGHRIGVRLGVLQATVGGGFVRTDADWDLSIVPADVGAELAAGSRGDRSRFVIYTAQTAATITVSVIANDRHNNTPAAVLPVTLTAIPLPVGFDVDGIATIAATADNYLGIGNVQATGGLGPYSYTIGGSGAGDIAFRINANSGAVEVRARAIGLATMTIGAGDSHEFSDDATTVIIITSSPGIVLPVPASFQNLRLTTQDTLALQVQLDDFAARGGTNISYAFLPPNPMVDNLVSFTTLQVGGAPVARLRLRPFFTSPLVPTGRIPLTVVARGTNVRGVEDAATASFAADIVDPPPLMISIADGDLVVRPAAGIISVAFFHVGGDLRPQEEVQFSGDLIAGTRIFTTPRTGPNGNRAMFLQMQSPSAARTLWVITLRIANRHTRLSAFSHTASISVITQLEADNALLTAVGNRDLSAPEAILTITPRGGESPYRFSHEAISQPAQMIVGAESGIVYLVGTGANNSVQAVDNYRTRIIIRDSASTQEVATMTITANLIRALSVFSSVPQMVTVTTNVPVPNGRITLATVERIGGFLPVASRRAANSDFTQATLAANTETAGARTRHFVEMTAPAQNVGTFRHITEFSDGRDNRVYATLSVVVADPPPLVMGFVSPPVLVHDVGNDPAFAFRIGDLTVGGGSEVPHDYDIESRPLILPNNTTDNGTVEVVYAAGNQYFVNIKNRSTMVSRHTLTLVLTDGNNHPRVRDATVVLSVTVVGELTLPGGEVNVVNFRPVTNNAEILQTLAAVGGQPPYAYSGTNLNIDTGDYLSIGMRSGAAVVSLVADTFTSGGQTYTGINSITTSQEYEVVVTDSDTPPSSATGTLRVNFTDAPQITARVLSSVTAVLQGDYGAAIDDVIVFENIGGGWTGSVFQGNTHSSNDPPYRFGDGGVVGGELIGLHSVAPGSTPSRFAGVLRPFSANFSGLLTIRDEIRDYHNYPGITDNAFRFSLTVHVVPTISASFTPNANGGALEYRSGFRQIIEEYTFGRVSAAGGFGNISHNVASDSPDPANQFPVIFNNTEGRGGFNIAYRIRRIVADAPLTVRMTITIDDETPITPPVLFAHTITILPPLAVQMSPPLLIATVGVVNGPGGFSDAAYLTPSGGQPPYFFRPNPQDSPDSLPRPLRHGITHDQANGSQRGTVQWRSGAFNDPSKGNGSPLETASVTVQDSSSPRRQIVMPVIRLTFVNIPLTLQRANLAVAPVAGTPLTMFRMINTGGSGAGYSVTVLNAGYVGGGAGDLDITAVAASIVVSASRGGEITFAVEGADARNNKATLSITITAFSPLAIRHLSPQFIVATANIPAGARDFIRVVPSGGNAGPGVSYRLTSGHPSNLDFTFTTPRVRGDGELFDNITGGTESAAGLYLSPSGVRDGEILFAGSSYRQTVLFTNTIAVAGRPFAAGFAPAGGFLPLDGGLFNAGTATVDNGSGLNHNAIVNVGDLQLSVVAEGITIGNYVVDVGANNGSHSNFAISVRAPRGNFIRTVTVRQFSRYGEHFAAEAIVTGHIPLPLGFNSAVIGNNFSTVIATSANRIRAGVVPATGGISTYTYAVFGGNDDIDVFINAADGIVSVQADAVGEFAITISVSEPHPDIADAGITVTISAAAGVALNLPENFPAGGVSVTTYAGPAAQLFIGDEDFALGRLTPQGGNDYRFSFVGNGGDYVRVDSGSFSVIYIARPASSDPNTVAVSIVVDGFNPVRNRRELATAVFNLLINDPPLVTAITPAVNPRFFLHNFASVPLVTVTATAGYRPSDGAQEYRYVLAADSHPGLNIGENSGVLTFPNPATVDVSIVYQALGHRHGRANPGTLTLRLQPLLSLTAFFDPGSVTLTIGGTLSRSGTNLPPLQSNLGAIARCEEIEAPEGINDSYQAGSCFSHIPANTIPGGNAPAVALIRAEAGIGAPETAQTATATMTVRFVAPPEFSHTYESATDNVNIVETGATRDIATINLRGGYLISGERYAMSVGAESQGRLSVTDAGRDLGADGIFIHQVSADSPTTLTATVFARDHNAQTDDITVISTITLVDTLGAQWTPQRASITSYSGIISFLATVSAFGGLNPSRPVFHSSDLPEIQTFQDASGNRAHIFNQRTQRAPDSGEVVARVVDGRGISVFATVSVVIVETPTISFGFVGIPNLEPSLPESGATRATIATLTIAGGAPFRDENDFFSTISIVDGHPNPSLFVVSRSILVLNDVDADILAHSVTLQAIQQNPRLEEPQLTISVTVVPNLAAMGFAVTATHGILYSFNTRPIFTITARGGQSPYTFNYARAGDNSNLPNNIVQADNGEGQSVFFLRGGQQNGFPRQSQPLVVSVGVSDSATPGENVGLSVTIRFVDPALRLTRRSNPTGINSGAVVGNRFRAFFGDIRSGSSRGHFISVIAAEFVGGGGDNSAISVTFDTTPTHGSLPGEEALRFYVNVSASQAGTVSIGLEAGDDSTNRATMTLSVGFFTPVSASFKPGVALTRNSERVIYGETGEFVSSFTPIIHLLDITGGNVAADNDYDVSAPSALAFSFRSISRDYLARWDGTFPANAGTYVLPVVIRDREFRGNYPAYPPFRQTHTYNITQIVVSAHIAASLDRAPGPYNPAGFSTLGTILISGGITSAGLPADIATIGVTGDFLTASIAADGGIFAEAPGGFFSFTIIVQDNYLGEPIRTENLVITGEVPIRRLELSFTEGPYSVFLTLYQGTIGSISATRVEDGAGGSGNSAENPTEGIGNLPAYPAEVPASDSAQNSQIPTFPPTPPQTKITPPSFAHLPPPKPAPGKNNNPKTRPPPTPRPPAINSS